MKLGATLSLLALLPAHALAIDTPPDALSLQHEVEALRAQVTALQELTAKEAEERRLTAAERLIAGLDSERTRWTADIKNLNEQKVKLIGDSVLTASFLSYTGAFTREFRYELIYKACVGDLLERKVPLTTPFNLENLLTTDAIKQGWTAKGLPADEHSIQNGMLTTKASRFPLCIDPQQQAVAWIKNKEARSSLKVCSLDRKSVV